MSTTASTRSRRIGIAFTAILSIVAAYLPTVLFAPGAQAVHDTNVFELEADANAVDEAPPGEDWSTYFNGSNAANNCATTGDASLGSADAVQFTADEPGCDTTFFKKGGSKDDLDISSWEWTANNESPDKNEVTDSFAAGYHGTDGLTIYFGMDRFDTSGDAQVGFWFLKGSVGLNGDGTFAGTHQVGDVLVQSNFTNGGAVSNVDVYQWVGSGGSNGTLDLLASGADCASTGSGDEVCATVNTTNGAVSPWPYTDKGGNTSFQTSAFFEGGVNISQLFGSTPVCFSSFIAETRTSQSFDARLKDFALGRFDLCDLSVEKTGSELAKVGDSPEDDAQYTVTVSNTGVSTLYFDSISDTLVDQADMTIPAACDVLDGGESCEITYSYDVQAGDPDPLTNTVEVTYRGAANDPTTAVTRSDSHTTELFQPAVRVEKTGADLAQEGDAVTYEFTVYNESSSDSPDLILDSANDTIIGDVSSAATLAGCDRIAAGDDCTFTVDYTVQAGDPDPLVNVITVHYHPEGFPNDVTDDAQHSTDLFQPSIDVVKTGPASSKVGDDVTYTFTITNTSSSDTPDLVLDSVSDDVLGNLATAAGGAGCNTLASGDDCTFDVTVTVPDTWSDPQVNTVTVHYHPTGYSGTDVTDQDDHSLNLFQPSVDVTMTGTDLSKVGAQAGDQVTYDITITNTSSDDSPNLLVDSITHSILGDVSGDAPAACDELAPGASCSFSVDYYPQAGDPDPLVAQIDVHYHPDGFPNDITDSDTHETELFQPSVTVEKDGPTLSKVGDDVTYTFTIQNTSSADAPDLLVDSIDDTVLGDLTGYASYDTDCDTLASGEWCEFSVTYTIQAGDPDPIDNTVTVHYHPRGFPNDITAESSHSVNLFQPSVDVDMSGTGLSKVGAQEGDQVTYDVTITNTSSDDSPNLQLVSVDHSILGDLTATASANGCDDLAPGASCSFSVDYYPQAGDPDPLVADIGVLYNPLGFPNEITSTDDHTTQLFQPDVTITKGGDTLAAIGETVTYDFTITNASSADAPDLVLDSVTDTLLGDLTATAAANGCSTLAYGGSCSFSVDRVVQSTDPDPLPNTVTTHYHPTGFPNDITATDDHEVNLFGPNFTVDKTGDTLSKIGDPVTYTFTITNTSDADTPSLLLVSLQDDKLPDQDLLDAANAAGCDELDYGETCTFDYTQNVPADAQDPHVNTFQVTYVASGFTQQVTHSDDHTLNLFQPGVTITKGGDALSTPGETVTYTFQIDNTSSADAPDLVLDSVTDTLLGDLTATAAGNGCSTLASGGSCSFTVDRTVLSDDPDPLPNTVTTHYHPTGFPNDITATDDHEVELFQPDFVIDKTGDELSKIGDPVTYTFTITNTSSADSPDLLVDSITDDKLGDLTAAASAEGCDVLNVGETCEFTVNTTVPQGATDPLENTVTAVYDVDGFGQTTLTRTDNHVLNLFQPSVDVTKTGDTLAGVGEPVDYTITIDNTSSDDSPNLVNGTVTDTLLGDLLDGANPYVTNSTCGTTLPTGGSCTIEATRTVLAGDPDPLPNTVTATYNPDGFTNVITDSDDHEVNLFQQSVTIDKSGDELSKIGDDVDYTFTITNTSSDDTPTLTLTSLSDDQLAADLEAAALVSGCGELDPGESCSFVITEAIPEGADDPHVNVVSVAYGVSGFANSSATASDDHTVNLFQPSVTVTKSGDTLSAVGETVTYDFAITNDGSADSPDLILESVTDTVLGDLTADAAAEGCDVLNVTETCEFSVTRTVQADDPDPLPNTVSVLYHPDGFPNDITDSDDHEVNLFQAGLLIDKSGDELSKIGDPVTYRFEITNTSSEDTPDLQMVSVVDDKLGDLTEAAGEACGTLASGESCVFTVDTTVPEGAEDPHVNTVIATYGVAGFTTTVTADDDHQLNLFQPSVTVTKSGDTLSAVGETVTYDFAITNDGSADSPDLILESVTDTVLGDLTADAAAEGCDVLNVTETCEFSVTRTVQADDPDPLPNTVSVLYHPDGFTNDIVDSDDHAVNLFQPAIVVTKDGVDLAQVGDTVTYDFTITNVSSEDTPTLQVIDVLDVGDGWDGLGDITAAAVAGGCETLDVGESCSFSVDYTVQSGDPNPLANTVTATYNPVDYTIEVSDADDHELTLIGPNIDLVKNAEIEPDADGFKFINCDEAGCPETTFTFTVTNTGDVALTDVTLTDDKFGDITIRDADGNVTTELAVGEVATGTATYVPSQADIDAGFHENTATVVGTAPDGSQVSDTDDEIVDIIEVLPLVIPKPPPLPATGFETERTAAFAFAMLALGIFLLTSTPRRRREEG